ncbi:MAG TPA: hypothetical protein VFO10_17030 [Oligoflexus sp.]|uniref:HEAT repeat domain-containing protein n=1 Tax=Oligoflexus sp. TaxID=1971216 RepID=UPI002D80851F|nr:hypothetical protein [Oligoflexus sp.]HET9238965.1 hypothetical protein [Oligoflexus sp.]
MKKRLLIVLGIGLLTFLTATGLYYVRPEALYSKAPRSGSSRITPIWTPQDIPLWTLVRGEELIYDLNYSGLGHFPGQSDQGFQVELVGTLHILVLSEETDGYRVWLSIRPEGSPQLTHIPAPLRSTLLKGWVEGTGARLATRGFFLQPEISSETDGAVAQFWQSLGERTQVVLPASLATPTWDQQESMAGGATMARYEIDPTSLSPALFAEKIYIQKSFDAAPIPQKKISGESLILMRPHFEGLEQLQADTREVQDLNGQSWSSDTVLKLHWQKRITQNETRVASLEARWGQSQSEGGSSEEASIQKVALGSLGLEDLWGQMHQPGTQNSQELYLKLKAWIYLHPLEIRRLMERLKVLDESDPALKMTIRALAASGQPEAQKALVDLLDQRQSDVPLARKIITTLGLLPEPAREAQESLENFSRGPEDSPVRRSSRLALGMMGQRLSQVQNPEAQKRAQHLEALALQNLRQAEGLGATTEALAVLGNCGVSRIEDLDPWLTHPDPAIRGQAFFALRFAKPLNTPDYLVLHYPMEASAEVRRQILQAISLRTPDDAWFQALRKLAAQALPDDDKITLAKSLVGTVRKYRESSLKIIAQLLEQTQDAAVRESLAKYQETAKKQVAL